MNPFMSRVDHQGGLLGRFFWTEWGPRAFNVSFFTVLLWITWRLHAHDTFALPYLQWVAASGRLLLPAPDVLRGTKKSKEPCTWNFRTKNRLDGVLLSWQQISRSFLCTVGTLVSWQKLFRVLWVFLSGRPRHFPESVSLDLRREEESI